MHKQVLSAYLDFKKEFLDIYKDEKIKILEVGSRLEQSKILLRDYTINPNWEFIGLDINAGRNVDIITKDPYHYPFEDNSFDLVMSSNTIEHVQDMFLWIKEIARITKNLVWIMVPNTYREHGRFDYWRVFPKGMEYLLKDIAGLNVIKTELSKYNIEDTIGIAKKIII